MLLLDTHIWLWWLLGDGALNNKEREALDRAAESGELSISWVTVWETEMLERKGRIELKPGFQKWIEAAVQPRIATLLPVDTEVVSAQRKLPDSFHGDPADRLIAATSILSQYPLVTHDRRIRESGACKIAELS
ncbi:type II toxin-antitoxin system VapC family toxin [Rhodohalobacter sp. SW132]|uniref:type II toxin-antitoxin system VapC family toxin n=1 Tax=Rhodohalobacter sp. SW132 TaxID=2293433 RepID=UPI000E27C4A7|nr:type II toxin-antitoxin system VapC family toxin [Rhodohalobacter sp. SW132]REL33423.1 type II toxin-antitoxin system VapC family toxin [Rhodohalobacter sp. SW132]